MESLRMCRECLCCALCGWVTHLFDLRVHLERNSSQWHTLHRIYSIEVECVSSVVGRVLECRRVDSYLW